MAHDDFLFSENLNDIDDGIDPALTDELQNRTATGIDYKTFVNKARNGVAVEAPTQAELFMLLNKMHERWVSNRSQGHDPGLPMSSLARILFEVIDMNKLEWKELETLLSSQMLPVCQLLKFFTSTNLLGNYSSEELPTKRKFQQILESIYQFHELLVSEHRLTRLADPTDDCSIPPELSLFRYSPLQFDCNTPVMNLIVYLLKILSEKGYRRKHDKCYVQITVETQVIDPVTGQPKTKWLGTRAWKEVCTISDFIYKYTKKEYNCKQWSNLLRGKGNHAFALEYLTNAQLVEFQDYKPCRYIFSFQNGLFNAENCSFFSYDSPDIDSNVTACKFFPQTFETQKYFEIIRQVWKPAMENESPEQTKQRERNNLGAWYNIPTPHFQGILDYQRFGKKDDSDEFDAARHRDVCKVIYGSMGRLFFEVGQKDHWEVVFFIKGVAQSGKSTIGKLCRHFYVASDVAILASNVEKKFGLSPIKDKYIYLCLEVKQNFALDQADFQSMVSGEDMSIAVKCKPAETVIWTVPGYLFGNEAANWLDASGSIGRRLPVIEFNIPVHNSDTDLYKKIINEEMPTLMFKCASAYFEMCVNCKGTGIWNCLPAYFIETKKRLALQISPLTEFLCSDQVTLGKSKYMPLSELQRMFKDWLRDVKGQRMEAMGHDQMRTPFANCGIYVDRKKLLWHDKKTKQLKPHYDNYAMGVTMRGAFDDDDTGPGAGAGPSDDVNGITK
jgi:hypothetical protein